MNAPIASPPEWIRQVHIRTVTAADLTALEWDGEYQHFRRLYTEMFQSASQGRAVLWVAVLPEYQPRAVQSPSRGLIGQVFVQLTSGRPELADGYQRAYIYGFRIKAAYRNAGLGTRMMEVVENDLLRRGYRYATLNVSCDNPGARRLYERLDYRVVGSEAGDWSYVDDRGQRREVHEPAWRMEKSLLRPGGG